MKLTHFLPLTASVVALLSGCAANAPFEPEVLEKVSPTFHFEAWRDAGPSNESGKSDAGIKVMLGGRIVQTTKNGKGLVIVAEHLPIVNHPVYGPTEGEGKRLGDHEFAFLYEGALEGLDLMKGIGPFPTRKEAEAAEKGVAAALKKRGHLVFWG